MASTKSDTNSYLGMLIGNAAYSTTFLRDILLKGSADTFPRTNDPIAVQQFLGNVKSFPSFEFPLSQSYTLAAASQPDIDEDAAVAGATASTIARTQETNVVGFHQKKVNVSYAKLSSFGTLGGVNIAGEMSPFENELLLQLDLNLRQIAIDLNYSVLNGTYEKAATTADSMRTRGIITASTINTVDGGAAVFTKAMLEELILEMVLSGAIVDGATLYVNPAKRAIINTLYGYAQPNFNVGGTSVTAINTSHGTLTVKSDVSIPTAKMLIANPATTDLVIMPVVTESGSSPIVIESLGKVGAAAQYQVALYAGINYGSNKMIGTITNLG
jgi:hypothetical protein